MGFALLWKHHKLWFKSFVSFMVLLCCSFCDFFYSGGDEKKKQADGVLFLTSGGV